MKQRMLVMLCLSIVLLIPCKNLLGMKATEFGQPVQDVKISTVGGALQALEAVLTPAFYRDRKPITMALLLPHLAKIKILLSHTSMTPEKINQPNELGQTELGHFIEIFGLHYSAMNSEMRDAFIGLIKSFVVSGADVNLKREPFPFSAYEQSQMLDAQHKDNKEYKDLTPHIHRWALEYRKPKKSITVEKSAGEWHVIRRKLGLA